MGEAKHKRSRCNCGRVGAAHRPECPALSPTPRIELFTVGLDKSLATEIGAAHEQEQKEGAPGSVGDFIVALMKLGLHALAATREKAAQRDSLVHVATLEQRQKLSGSLLGGR